LGGALGHAHDLAHGTALATRSAKERRLFGSSGELDFAVQRLNFKAFWIETWKRSGLGGLTKKSSAPARIAATAVSTPPCAVRRSRQ